MQSNTAGSVRMAAMIPNNARCIDSVPWLPAERLGQFNVDAPLRSWLIGKGLITLRMKAACGERFGLRLVEQWTGLLNAVHKSALRAPDNAGLFRETELRFADQVWVFAQTVIPDSTLCMHPWLAELGDSSLGETLNELSGVERSAYEYAWLPAGDALCARALREADLKPAGLWARRSRVQLRAAPLLAQEVFLPAMGRT
jgi:chorismate--pyruvate lyase